MVDETKTDDNLRTITTWDAPWGGTILIPSGIATRVLIPIPGTERQKIPRGLVLSLLPPPYYDDPKAVPPRKSTSTIFFRNPDDLTFGEPGLRLDFGKNKNTGGIDYHWNVEGRGAARQRFPNITNHMSAGKTGEIVYRAAKAFRIAGRVFMIYGATVDGISIVLSTRPLERSIEVITAWTLAGAGAIRLGSFGADIGTDVLPGYGTVIGGGIGAVVGSIVGYWAGETGVRYLYSWPRDTLFKPFPEVTPPSTR